MPVGSGVLLGKLRPRAILPPRVEQSRPHGRSFVELCNLRMLHVPGPNRVYARLQEIAGYFEATLQHESADLSVDHV
jgi:hypothetical protein